VSKIGDVILRELLHRSPIFTTENVARAAEVRPEVASRYLNQQAKKDVIMRITRGIWADSRHPDFSPYAVVPYLLGVPTTRSRGYVSLLSALSLHRMIEQIPRSIQVVSHMQRRPLRTPAGTYEFHRMDFNLIGGSEPHGQFGNFEVATPAKAIFDTLYFSVRRGRRFFHLPELQFTSAFKVSELHSWIARIPYARLQVAVYTRWRQLQQNSIGCPDFIADRQVQSLV
jgi:hypothetical protein